jgi:hypothetical protein
MKSKVDCKTCVKAYYILCLVILIQNFISAKEVEWNGKMNICFIYKAVLVYVNQESMKSPEENETSEKHQFCYPETTPRFKELWINACDWANK